MQIRKHIYFRFLITIVVLMIISFGANAQYGIIKGKVIDKKTKEPIPFASVIIEKEGKPITGIVADIDGNYTITQIQPGIYNVKSTCIGYKTIQINNLLIKTDSIYIQDINLAYYNQHLPIFCLPRWRIPLISTDPDPSGQIYPSWEINKMAW
jgi:hypothetical protein